MISTWKWWGWCSAGWLLTAAGWGYYDALPLMVWSLLVSLACLCVSTLLKPMEDDD